MPNVIEGYRMTRFGFPRDRIIGDSQVRFEYVYLIPCDACAEQP